MGKRRYSDVESEDALPLPHCCDCRNPKRPYKAHPSPHSHHHQHLDLASSIGHWLDKQAEDTVATATPPDVYSDDELDLDLDLDLDPDASSMPQTPSAQSRSSSPSKPKQAQNYRVHNLRYANIRIDVEVSDSVMKRIKPPPALPDTPIHAVAKQLYEGARGLLKQGTSNEDQWQELLKPAITRLMGDSPDLLKLLPKRDWNKFLKPVAYIPQLPKQVPQKRQPSTSQPAVENVSTAPEPDTGTGQDQRIATSALPSPSPSTTNPSSNKPDLPPPTKIRSLASYVRGADWQQPKFPKPDLTIGLQDTSAAWSRVGLPSDIGDILDQAQLAALPNNTPEADAEDVDWENGLISDPFALSPSGLRFPFLVVELKSELSTLTEAENQAAVSGACALRMLESLAGGSEDPFPLRTFSVVTSGPTQSLWAHVPPVRKAPSDPSNKPEHNPYSSFSSGWDMIWLGTYRISDQESALELTRKLADILTWGRDEFRPWVVARLMDRFGVA